LPETRQSQAFWAMIFFPMSLRFLCFLLSMFSFWMQMSA
jgi:hypothetical protein